jgi:LmbE family N-acetylglucosaminyl deacetylase
MPDEPRRVMVIAAHPDDFELCCAGTVARWMRQGWQARLVLVSSGDKGTANTMTKASTTSAAVLSQRHAEQQAAGAVIGLGTEDIVYLGQTDGELAPTMELRRLLAQQIRLFQPHALFTHDPWRPYLLHPDHRAVGIGVTDAISAARDPLNFPEQLGGAVTSWRVTDVYYFATIWPDTFVDVTDTFELKLNALRQHAGQMAGMPGMEERLRELATEHGKRCGARYAEAFKLMTVTIYPDL